MFLLTTSTQKVSDSFVAIDAFEIFDAFDAFDVFGVLIVFVVFIAFDVLISPAIFAVDRFVDLLIDI